MESKAASQNEWRNDTFFMEKDSAGNNRHELLLSLLLVLKRKER